MYLICIPLAIALISILYLVFSSSSSTKKILLRCIRQCDMRLVRQYEINAPFSPSALLCGPGSAYDKIVDIHPHTLVPHKRGIDMSSPLTDMCGDAVAEMAHFLGHDTAEVTIATSNCTPSFMFMLGIALRKRHRVATGPIYTLVNINPLRVSAVSSSIPRGPIILPNPQTRDEGTSIIIDFRNPKSCIADHPRTCSALYAPHESVDDLVILDPVSISIFVSHVIYTEQDHATDVTIHAPDNPHVAFFAALGIPKTNRIPITFTPSNHYPVTTH